MNYEDLTLSDLINAINFYYKGIKRQSREAWERARWLAYIGLLPHKDRRKALKPTDLALFTWEAGEDKAQSREEIQAALNRVAKRTGQAPKYTLADGTVLVGIITK